MQREEDILYPAACQRLSPVELGEIDASLRHFDEAHASERNLDAHLELARAMGAKYAGTSQR
jgi:hemerythrin-like domain-containing protein